ncbi:PWI domain-containing protein [Protomyces lactucae-debilis]|uniref:PWI domain-containing protein n=1 Tax=Protomyces lactucae-debilis TaxID=2754530 RepID=A0A1Y2ENP3_PROLT|nr:PWI domain-containing protein [Protomyces lactucae-debilis]ORY73200.1 PWI domain-containing protein [Protomyces lactucae-debilis]
MDNVSLDAMQPWIVTRVTDLLGFEDEIVCSMVTSYLEGERYPDRKVLADSISGFLGDGTDLFTRELWELLDTAQTAPAGIPPAFVEQKKRELAARRFETERVDAQIRTHDPRG